MGLVFSSPNEAVDAIGQNLGSTDWLTIDQVRIDMFAEATGDHQWIHVDPVRAKDGPFGGTVAHGCLTFSLINGFLPDLFKAEGMKMGINYGCDRLRFPAPVPVNSKVRATGELVNAEFLPGNAVQTTVRVTIEIEGSAKPACVADMVGRYYF
ncbi:MaoC family dehydratase [Aminobacter sp. NyZ550]|jgi:acyl dehydratase|uniref:MaoC family dehydratase n=1 Tax=Aminobacter sp. NyZ550 TaxID=2979870 RepID=UPI0021D5750F|nr:MaoC family dehydratase [Aminobacter sp. NyZ550]WAX93525.1 MaoC family dehydratase [Aminobacter sp. NyZ550]